MMAESECGASWMRSQPSDSTWYGRGHSPKAQTQPQHCTRGPISRSTSAVARGLDFVVQQARLRQLRLILPIMGYWRDMGGLQLLQRWCLGDGGDGSGWDPVDNECPRFYSEPACRQLYLRHARDLMSRLNSLTGLAYNEDPTILIWELCNECRCRTVHVEGEEVAGVGAVDVGAVGVRAATAAAEDAPRELQAPPQSTPQPPVDLDEWAAYMAPRLRELAPRQLISMGGDGFFFPTSASAASVAAATSQNPQPTSNPGWFVHEGVDFERTGAAFAAMQGGVLSYHLHPQDWMGLEDEDARVRFLNRWITSHARVADGLHAPLYLGEYSVADDPVPTPARTPNHQTTHRDHAPATHGGGRRLTRDAVYASVLRTLSLTRPMHSGFLFWQLTLQGIGSQERALVVGRSSDRAVLDLIRVAARAFIDGGAATRLSDLSDAPPIVPPPGGASAHAATAIAAIATTALTQSAVPSASAIATASPIAAAAAAAAAATAAAAAAFAANFSARRPTRSRSACARIRPDGGRIECGGAVAHRVRALCCPASKVHCGLDRAAPASDG